MGEKVVQSGRFDSVSISGGDRQGRRRKGERERRTRTENDIDATAGAAFEREKGIEGVRT